MSYLKVVFFSGILVLLSAGLMGCNAETPTQSPAAQVPIPAEETCPYRLPWANTKGVFRVTQSISDPTNESHKPGELGEFAIDFALPEGTPVLATRDGIVTAIHDGETLFGGPDKAGYANYVIIEHANSVFTAYWHLRAGIPVQQGQTVVQGQRIGDSGKTGWTKGRAHLHYQLQSRGDRFGQSIEPCFAEVEEGVPLLDAHYASQNQETPGQGLIFAPAEEIPEISGGVTGKAVVEPDFPASLNRFSQASVLEWLVYSLTSGDTTVFDSLITADTISYGTGFAGGRSEIPKAEFLAMVQERIANHPVCLGFSSLTSDSMVIWTGNWKPEWVYPGATSQDEITLSFYSSALGFYLSSAYFTPASAVMEVPSVNAKPCLFFEESTGSNLQGQIAYIVDGYESDSIELINADGSGSRVIITVPLLTDLTWFPDGTIITYSGGGQLVNILLSNGETEVVFATETPGYEYFKTPRWLPDGSALVFLALDQINFAEGTLRGRIRISTRPRDVRDILVSDQTAIGTEGLDVSKSGQIVYQTFSESPIYGYGLSVTDLSGSAIQILLPIVDTWIDRPSWSPDGNIVAFAKPRGPSGTGPLYLWLINADGTNLRQLTTGEYVDSSPSWSPDGEWIAFVRGPASGGNVDIWLVSVDGETLINLTNSPGKSEIVPAWKP